MSDNTSKMHLRPRWGKTRADRAPVGERQAIRSAAALTRAQKRKARGQAQPLEETDA